MTARILTRDEVAATHDAGESWASRRGDYCALVFRRGETIAAVNSDDGNAIDDRHAALMAAAPDLRATALDALDRLSVASARIAELERLAAGPRLAISGPMVDAIDGATAGPQNVDANGSHAGDAT